ncbi:MAG: hypothetical protein QX197_01095 [Methylococcaceae bacterium]
MKISKKILSAEARGGYTARGGVLVESLTYLRDWLMTSNLD